MSDVPDDILTRILSRLAVKDLLRCRCVLKSWCNLIDSPDFVKIDLKHSKETNSNTGYFLIGKQNELHWLDLNTPKSVVKLNLSVHPGCGYQVVGSCNGLLALSASDCLFTLRNPFTRRSINLPLPKTRAKRNACSKDCHSYNYGVGYDPIGDDYKLVRICGFRKDCECSEGWFMIYSLKRNSWTRVGGFPYWFYNCWGGRITSNYECSDGILLNNALHWVVYPKEESIASKFILAFDLVSEEYRQVPIPHNDNEKYITRCQAGTLGGCLCVNYSWGGDLNCTDVWVMKEYGVKESWTKLFSASDSCKAERVESVDIPICVQSLVGLNDGCETFKEGGIVPWRRSNDGEEERNKRRRRCSQLGG